jgi:hypothetical protein
MDRWMDGWMDGWMDEWMDGWMDVACLFVSSFAILVRFVMIRV